LRPNPAGSRFYPAAFKNLEHPILLELLSDPAPPKLQKPHNLCTFVSSPLFGHGRKGFAMVWANIDEKMAALTCQHAGCGLSMMFGVTVGCFW
jgi:hypothetical protein